MFERMMESVKVNAIGGSGLRRNQIFAGLTGSVIAGLTAVISLSPTFWIIVVGSLVLVSGFATLAWTERNWGPVDSGNYYYVFPMIIGPALAGLMRGTDLAIWLGVPAGLLCGAAAYLLVMKYPHHGTSSVQTPQTIPASLHDASQH